MAEILRVENLKKHFNTRKGVLHAVDGVTFGVQEGQTLGIVGESGCGKSTLGRVILHLHEKTAGKIIFNGEDISDVSQAKLKKLREDMQIIFQDPYASLNPRMTVGDIIGEPDGGRRQRVGTARALILDPKLIVCDEPVSALDVSIQAQILNLMMDLQKERNLTYLFITHNLSVVKHISDDITVMYLGQMVEKAKSSEIFAHQYHPYTKALISAIPLPKFNAPDNQIILKGEITSPIKVTKSCRFAPRCNYAKPECFHSEPGLEEISKDHFVKCHFVREINGL